MTGYSLAKVSLGAVMLAASFSAQATLMVEGRDSLGNQLIYDNVLNVTWYDFTSDLDTWQNQVNWAQALTVNFGGSVYSDWRLPTTLQPDPSCLTQFDAGGGVILSMGLGCTGSEMGHLRNADLLGFNDSVTFENLKQTLVGSPAEPIPYWSSTLVQTTPVTGAWSLVLTGSGQQFGTIFNIPQYAIAVRDGNVSLAPAPEPATLFLLGSGIVAIGAFRRKKANRIEKL